MLVTAAVPVGAARGRCQLRPDLHRCNTELIGRVAFGKRGSPSLLAEARFDCEQRREMEGQPRWAAFVCAGIEEVALKRCLDGGRGAGFQLGEALGKQGF